MQRGHAARGEALDRAQVSKVHVAAAAGRALHRLRGGCWVITGVVRVAAGTRVVGEGGVVVVGEVVDVAHAVGRVIGGRVRSEARLPVAHQDRD